jgi:hypothetical protein
VAQLDDERWSQATWIDELNFLGANALIGGLSGGIVRALRGGSFADGFARGALGGGVGYVGKRTAAADFDGAGFLGREIGAVGASMTRSAAFGSGWLDTLVVPLGPLRAYVPRARPGRLGVRVDLTEAVQLVYALQEDRLDFDLVRSLSAGVPVFVSELPFRDDADEYPSGIAWPGLVVLRGPDDDVWSSTPRHEQVHVVQFDFMRIAMGLPLEGWIADLVNVRALPLLDHVDFGVGDLPLRALASEHFIGRENSLIEVEAEYLVRDRR